MFHLLPKYVPVSLTLLSVTVISPAEPVYRSQLIEPLNELHNHGSCIVVLPNGDLLAAWYKGTGERTADDVRIVGARLRKGEKDWSEVFEMADIPGFPDCNASMGLDAEGKLWLFWPLIIANQWETALLMSRCSTSYEAPGPPRWDWQAPIILKPGKVFAEDVIEGIEDFKKTLPGEILERYADEIEELKQKARDKYFRRMGWMPRAKPTLLPDGRFLLPLYSDGFSFSLVAVSDDNGSTWKPSRPILSVGGVQPSIVCREDGSLVAYLRDNGPPPKRIIVSESRDRGETWTRGRDSDLLDSGAGVQALRLENGHWIVLHNDLEKGRHSLALHLSEDEGRTWPWVRHLEQTRPGEGSFSYPSLVQDREGLIHATYSYRKDSEGPGSTIKYACFNEEWIRAGD